MGGIERSLKNCSHSFFFKFISTMKPPKKKMKQFDAHPPPTRHSRSVKLIIAEHNFRYWWNANKIKGSWVPTSRNKFIYWWAHLNVHLHKVVRSQLAIDLNSCRVLAVVASSTPRRGRGLWGVGCASGNGAIPSRNTFAAATWNSRCKRTRRRKSRRTSRIRYRRWGLNAVFFLSVVKGDGCQFQVGTVVLYGIPIVSLVIESQERLCLAQISNTLLKQFSYNEIHNRRVALGECDLRFSEYFPRNHAKIKYLQFLFITTLVDERMNCVEKRKKIEICNIKYFQTKSPI